MRKQLKLKRRSCAMCKPHKMHRANRWKAHERDALLRAERQIRNARSRSESYGI